MYRSKYYTCEEIDERLLKGYYDDVVSKGYTDTLEQFQLELAYIGTIEPGAQVNHTIVLDGEESDLDVSDPDGNVIARFKNGHIQTKNFNSEVDVQTSVVNGEDADLDIADEQGNAIACFSGGEFQTKNFNTANTPAQADDNGTAEFQISDPDGNVIAEFQGGHFRTKEFDSRNVSGAEVKVIKDEQGRNILLLSKGVVINKKLYL